jgi:outer membrane protein OmpA-like peptidoglycan-associated protein
MKRPLALIGLLITALVGSAAVPDVSVQYKDAVKLYRRGEYQKAETLFKSIKDSHPSYRRTTAYLAQCRERLRDEAPMAYYERAAAQAREILDLRKTMLKHVRTQYPDVAVTLGDDGTVIFSFPTRMLFPGKNNDFSAEGTAFLGLVKDLALTYQTLHVSIVAQQPATPQKGPDRRNERRAIALGSTFFRHGGIAPPNIRVRSRTGDGPLLIIRFHTQPPKENNSETPLRGAMAEVKNPLVDPRVDWPLSIDLSLLDPARVKSWSLKIVAADQGHLVREFRGTSDVWVSVAWDGTTAKGWPAPAGEYQVFLSAVTLGGEQLQDSTAFFVRPPKQSPPSSAPIRSLPPPPPPKSPADPPTRKWAHVIGFSYNRWELAGTGELEVKQLALNIKAFPDENVVIEGFADDREDNSEELARRRGETVRSLLVEKHGVTPKRLTVKSKDPRRPMEGEILQKAVVFFVGSGQTP